MADHLCIICGSEIPNRCRKNATCGKPECRAERKRQRENAYNARTRFETMTGAEREALRIEQVVCGAWAKADRDERGIIEALNKNIMFVEEVEKC